MGMAWPQAKDPSIRKKAKDNRIVNGKVFFFIAFMPPFSTVCETAVSLVFYMQLNFDKIQKLPMNLLIVPLEAFSRQFLSRPIEASCPGSRALNKFFIMNSIPGARAYFCDDRRANQRPTN